MLRRFLLRCFAGLLLAASPALTLPRAASLQPHEQKSPTPLLQRPGQDDAAGLLAFCLVQFALGDFTAAEEACGQVLALDPKRADAFKLRGYAYMMEARDEEAAADFRAGLKLNPADDQLAAGYGQALSNLGHYQASVVQFRKALGLTPGKAAYLNGLCWAQAGTGKQLDQALSACNKAINLEPTAAAPRNSRGLVYLRLRRFQDAIADYSKSLRLSPDLPSAHFGLGLARLSSGNGAGASDIREARNLNPGIDRLFISMGLLPERCSAAASVPCPPGFPAAITPQGNSVTARAPASMRQQLIRMAGFLPH